MQLERLTFVIAAVTCLCGAAAAGTTVLGADLPDPVLEPVPRSRSRHRHVSGIDPLEYGVEFARLWKQVQDLPTDVRADAWRPADERYVLGYVDLVPPPVLRVLADHGGRLVCFEGSLTDLPENEDLRGVPCRLYDANDVTYDTLTGLYRSGTRTAFAKVDRDRDRARTTVLHELAHMLDDALGKPSQLPEFYEVLDHDDEGRDLGYPERVSARHRKATEYYAVSFALYMSGGEWRRWMRSGRPAAAAYWDEALAGLSETHYQRTEIAARRAARRR
jgi:hypothetical protein